MRVMTLAAYYGLKDAALEIIYIFHVRNNRYITEVLWQLENVK